jgi:hypothetical protein
LHLVAIDAERRSDDWRRRGEDTFVDACPPAIDRTDDGQNRTDDERDSCHCF